MADCFIVGQQNYYIELTLNIFEFTVMCLLSDDSYTSTGSSPTIFRLYHKEVLASVWIAIWL